MLQLTVERKARGWSQTKLSEMTGISQCVLSRIESEEVEIFPGWKKRISDAFKINQDILFSDVKIYGGKE